MQKRRALTVDELGGGQRDLQRLRDPEEAGLVWTVPLGTGTRSVVAVGSGVSFGVWTIRALCCGDKST